MRAAVHAPAAARAADTRAAAPAAILRLGPQADPAERHAETQAARLLAPANAPEEVGAPRPFPSAAAGAPGLGFPGGRPLAARERDYFEPRLDRSLDEVRVHRGPGAALAARAIGAGGFTVGREIVLGGGDPDGTTLAHELAHVAQGEGGVVRRRWLGQDAMARSLHPREVAALNAVEAQALYDFLTTLAQSGHLDDPAFADNYATVRVDIERRHAVEAAPPKPAEPKAVPVPAIGGRDSAASLETIMQAIAGMQQISSDADGGRFDIEWNGRRQVVSGTGAAEISAKAIAELSRGLGSAIHMAAMARGLYDRQSEADRKSWIAAPVVKFIGQIKDPGPVMLGLANSAEAQGAQAQAALAAGDLVGAARLMAGAETSARQASTLVHTYWGDIIATAEVTQTVLEYTRDISLGVAVTIAAVLAAPLVAGVVAGAGLTGGLATGATILGTGVAVGTGTGLVKGGAAAAGVGLSGGSSGEAFDAFGTVGREGAVEGFLAGAGGAAARALGPALGIGGKGGAQFVRRVAAQAIVNSGSTMIDALAHGASIEEAAKRGALAAVTSVPGAAVGGAKSRLVQEIAAPLVAGGTAYTAAIAQGAPPEQARRAATVAMTTALIAGRAVSGRQNDAALEERGKAMAKGARNTVAGFGAAAMIGTADGLERAADSSGSGPAIGAIATSRTPPSAPTTTNTTADTRPAAPATAPAAKAVGTPPAQATATKAASPTFAGAQPPLVRVPILAPTQPTASAAPAAAPAQATAQAAPEPTTPAAAAATAAAAQPATIVGSARPGANEALVGSSQGQMRRAAQRIIAASPIDSVTGKLTHILHFLLGPDGQFKSQSGLTAHHILADRPDLVQMGHIGSNKLGGTERLMLQGAWENQFSNVTIESPHRGGAVLEQPAISLGGIAVDLQTAKSWESFGLIPSGSVAAAPRIIIVDEPSSGGIR